MNRELNVVQKSNVIALGRNHNVGTHAIPEPLLKDGQQEERAVRYHVLILLRTVEIREHVAIKRVLRLGRWQGVSDS